MLNSKQRAFLRSLAADVDTIVMVGKGGLTDNIVKQTEDALTARELVKGKALETSPHDARGCADRLAAATGADVVQVIGRKFVLFRVNKEKPVIELPKAKGRR
ncbi:MAG: ribosome assembly RNA-binding protein YhbY [Clostridia bacterium]|nr:ribosome assembly RNA-binding protein YhbY [Clostridia bacterium]MBQ1555011.1 ribosome assembly RNA-binding protein YhbY [Clostridia bacterium]MBQ4397924.1 ribosome assembly RNA-binding protein YhbY [Clostridia bacterium]MBQ5545435.1 ribosome assembly RNA-binding protein YhbY [Clostridia bacterium]